MNATKKGKKNFKISELVLLGMAAVILAVGGIMHVYASNKGIETARKIDAVQKEIDQYNADVNMINVGIDRDLDRHTMKEDLVARGSELRATDPDQLEIVDPIASGSERLATASAQTEIAP